MLHCTQCDGFNFFKKWIWGRMFEFARFVYREPEGFLKALYFFELLL